MKKKKTVKASPKKVAVKKTKTVKKVKTSEASNVKFHAAAIPPALGDALSRILDLMKAMLYDAFKQYIEGKILQGLPATLEEFIELFSSSFKLHGITDEELIASLDSRRKDYLNYSAKLLEAKAPQGVKQVAAPLKDVSQAEKVNVNEFGIKDKTEKEAPKTSVFGSLDLL